MSSVNKVTLIGNLGANPDVRKMPDQTTVATISLATTEHWKNKEGAKKENTEWHRIVFYKGLADVVAEYLTKGSLVYIEGKLRTRKWVDQEGVERYVTEIRGDTLKMLGKKEPKDTPDAPKADDVPAPNEMEEDVPM